MTTREPDTMRAGFQSYKLAIPSNTEGKSDQVS